MLVRTARSYLEYLRTPKDRIVSARSADGISWQRESGVRIDVRKPSFDDEMVYGCYVRRDANRQFEMFYQASRVQDERWHSRILRSTSPDGLHWAKPKSTGIERGSALLIQNRVQSPHLVSLNGQEMMFLSGDGPDGVSRIVRATRSEQGWRVHDTPALSPDDFGNVGGRPVTALVDPTVAAMPDGRLRMYVSAVRESVFFQDILSASSADGLVWTPDRGVRIAAGERGYSEVANNPSVLRQGSRLLMAFRGSDLMPLGSSIYLASSDDGLNWTKPRLALKYSRIARYEGHGIGFPLLLAVDGGLRMYYTAFWGTRLCGQLVRNYHKWRAESPARRRQD